MGQVYLALDLMLGRHVVITLLSDAHHANDGRATPARARSTSRALDHPNICAVHEVESEGGRTFIVMQLVEGETLAGR